MCEFVCLWYVCAYECVCVYIGGYIGQCACNQKCYVSDAFSTTTLSPVDTIDSPVDFNTSKYAMVILNICVYKPSTSTQVEYACVI